MDQDRIHFHAQLGFLFLEQIGLLRRLHCESDSHLDLTAFPLAFIQAEDDPVAVSRAFYCFYNHISFIQSKE